MKLRRLTPPYVLLLASSVLVGICAWLYGHHYVNPEATFRWATIMGVLDAEDIRLEHIGLIYPHVPYYFLAPFEYLPGLKHAAAPYFLSALLGGALLAVWNGQMRAAGIGGGVRLLLILAIGLHPAFLWSATNGGHAIFGLIMFYALYRACLRMLEDQDVRSFITLAMVMALYFFVDEVAFYLFLALLPLLSLIAPRKMLMESPASVYAMILVPLVIAIAAWVYLNWIFHGDPWTFARIPWSAFLGNWQYAQNLPWLREYGGEFMTPAFIGLLVILVSYPVIVFLLWHVAGDKKRISAGLVLMLHPILAIGFATGNFFLGHPLELSVLVIGGVMAELSKLGPQQLKYRMSLSLLLAAGLVGGWATFYFAPTPDMQHWRQTMLAELHAAPTPEATELGQWLADNRQRTMIDNRSGYAVIVARGDAKGLLLPFADAFKIALRKQVPGVDQVVLPDPQSEVGRIDMINTQHPKAYEQGLPGYRLAYDRGGWRVYRRI